MKNMLRRIFCEQKVSKGRVFRGRPLGGNPAMRVCLLISGLPRCAAAAVFRLTRSTPPTRPPGSQTASWRFPPIGHFFNLLNPTDKAKELLGTNKSD
jgi:hypothetical protein